MVLVNPSDMGNMGTIIRTMLGFNYVNLAIIRPGVDVFDPRVIRWCLEMKAVVYQMNFLIMVKVSLYLIVKKLIL